MKTGTRVRSPKPPFYETALLSPSEKFVNSPDFIVELIFPEPARKVTEFRMIFPQISPSNPPPTKHIFYINIGPKEVVRHLQQPNEEPALPS